MTDTESTERGHCKDPAHVRVTVVDDQPDGGEGWAVGALELVSSCVNVPGYDGWTVQTTVGVSSGMSRPSLRLLPDLAEVLPVWLRRAARTAKAAGRSIAVEHTNDKLWLTAFVLTPAGARSYARSVARAAAMAPAGEHG